MQGFNMGRYYPPSTSSPPRFNTTHPLGARAAKLSQGILTVRFELPFAVWCAHCKPDAIIGQGVRFNAQKKKVGSYYSTPIWSFRMKHGACGGWWEIRTDPKAAEYVVVEGARRREYAGAEKEAQGVGEERFLSEEERRKRREDAFANLEGRVEDKALDQVGKERVEELYEKSEVWRDPYEVNARLRSEFRAKRRVWKKDERRKEGMQDKFSLGIDIVDESDADRMRAGLVEFAPAGSSNEKRDDMTWKPLFATPQNEMTTESTTKTKKLKADAVAEKSRRTLQDTLVNNTRAAVDPFLSARDGSSTSRPTFGILKRKRSVQAEPNPTVSVPRAALDVEGTLGCGTKTPTLSTALVGYDSD
ncbi:DUF572-domain-containing protein [Dothidotthia symphoricarpi CBS 119687]|uniref:DUF572-domain-containing protein n=1 Tax=Dothidotthia symphoricarpi CBS 119687 TaxID=1392245 RepID=A0A6A5ZYQ3_9PLEO|nr:DUF572-domain-containing protein [Dothidotthia symphoricarpi CBS 119687]KAF2123518.1 DUF572-domain-containing protein [Dothidotthia symphoricarpi CBS 119687]